MFPSIRQTILAVLCLTAVPAFAQQPAVDIIPAENLDEATAVRLDQTVETHPPLRLTPDKSELIRLGKPAGSIVIGNPSHLNILADSAETLIIVPRMAGASHFAVLDKQGEILMSRHVIVGSPKQKYVRVRRTCYGDYGVDDGCQPTRTYYCPDMCHEIATPPEGKAASGNAPAQDNMTAKADDKETAEGGEGQEDQTE